MANTITVTKTTADQWKNPQGWFETVWTVSGSFADQDAILATAIGEFDITVPGVAVGDMVVGMAIGGILDDGTDQAISSAYVAAANTVTVQVMADDGTSIAADTLNGYTFKMLIGRPAW